MTDLLTRLGLSAECSGAWIGEPLPTTGPVVSSINPATGEIIASVRLATAPDLEQALSRSQDVFKRWRSLPAPARGEIVRQMGEALRAAKDDLGALVSL